MFFNVWWFTFSVAAALFRLLPIFFIPSGHCSIRSFFCSNEAFNNKYYLNYKLCMLAATFFKDTYRSTFHTYFFARVHITTAHTNEDDSLLFFRKVMCEGKKLLFEFGFSLSISLSISSDYLNSVFAPVGSDRQGKPLCLIVILAWKTPTLFAGDELRAGRKPFWHSQMIFIIFTE